MTASTDDYPTLEVFGRLNRQMQIHRLFAMANALERSFQQQSAWPADKLEIFKQCLHAFEDSHVQLLSAKLSSDMSASHFMAIIVPLEREYNRTVVDSDFLVEEGDGRSVTQSIPAILILDNIRSAVNLGSIMRTSECFGVQRLFLCGYTAGPDNTKVKKSAMGTDQHLRFDRFASVDEAIAAAKELGFEVWAIETAKEALNLSSMKPKKAKLALVLGNERFGISAHSLSMADKVVRIPLGGKKNSLNVAVTAGIVLHHAAQQFN